MLNVVEFDLGIFDAGFKLNELFWLIGELVWDLVRSKVNSCWLFEADGVGWYWLDGGAVVVLNWY